MSSKQLQIIGSRISELRRQLHYTQEQLAEKMDVSIQMISNLERGNKSIRIENLIRLSEILNTSTDYILLGIHSGHDLEHASKKLAQLSDRDFQMIELLIDYCLRSNSNIR